jgi:hypothetical protein
MCFPGRALVQLLEPRAAFSFVPAAGFGAALACGFATYEFCKKACEAPDPIKVNEAAARTCLLEALPREARPR